MEEQIPNSHSTLHKYLFTVTTFSKILALLLFIILPFLGFFLGLNYQKALDNFSFTNYPIPKSMPVKTLNKAPTDSTIPTILNSWSTYKNSDYGVSFKYPSSWIPMDATQFLPELVNAGNVQTIVFFPKGERPRFSLPGERGNELLYFDITLYSTSKAADLGNVTITKEQFVKDSSFSGKLVTIAGNPASNDSEHGYTIWYNNRYALDFNPYENPESIKVIDAIVQSLQLTPKK